MRILIVEPDLADNGAIRVSLDRGLRWSRGSKVALLILSRKTSRGRETVGVDPEIQLHFGVQSTRFRPFTLIASMWRGIFLARRADVVVAGREIGDGLLVAGAVALIARRPLAVTVQSNVGAAMAAYVPAWIQFLNRLIYRRADLAVCVSAGLVASVLRIGVPRAKIEVVHNGIDFRDVQASARQAPAISLPEGRFIVSVGRLVRQKGFDLLIRAHARALAEGAPQHSLVIVGEGRARHQLEALASELGVAKTVIFLGFLSNPHAITVHADAYISSSRWEGFSLVLAEALALGVPIIATDCISGPSEILEQGRYGALVPPDDVAALSAALTDHLRDPEMLRAKAIAGSASVEQRFNLEQAASRHKMLLEKLAKNRTSEPTARARSRVGLPEEADTARGMH